MTLIPTKRFVNVKNAGFTPTGGSLIPLLGVSGWNEDPQATELRGSGDADFYDTFAGYVSANTAISFNMLNQALLDNISVLPGAGGTLTWTVVDGHNGILTGGGALIYTLINAIFGGAVKSNDHRVLGTSAIKFSSWSADGTTNPLSVAAA